MQSHGEVDRTAVKALVTVYGPREAARQSGIPVGTVLAWAAKYKWKKVAMVRGKGEKPKRDIADMLRASLEEARDDSSLNLAQYTKNASHAAAKSTNPLDIARKVRDVAGVYSILWPQEDHNELIEGAILIGTAPVTDNLEEIEAKAREVIELEDVRQELPDQGPAGH